MLTEEARMGHTTASVRVVKRILLIALATLVLGFAFLLFCNYWVKDSVKDRMYSSLEDLPQNDVALVLGTTPRLSKNIHNLYFDYRINAAHTLYMKGKVKHLILSGDNSQLNYNEPVAMQKALIKKGVPRDAITLDYAGFRTLDSVVRCREIFQQHKFTIVSQRFHNFRALFIAKAYDLDAVAFDATEPASHKDSKTLLREYLARCKAVLDLYILNKQPKYLGDKIDIEID